jgi:DNA invertase Pin-like site-specific DNA recombinase
LINWEVIGEAITMEGQTQRVLGAVRQSKTRDRAVSPAAQRRAIQGWADANSATVARITEDLSTSGSTSAFRRAGLGPWLTEDDKIAAWDVLVVTKLDRACRNVADYLKLAAWCDSHAKRLVVLDDPSLDTSTPQGRAMATMRATFAQLEREMDQQRSKERHDELAEQGRWTGGRLPYGWRYDRQLGRLVPDTEGTAVILGQMANMAIAGKSYGQIAQWLNGGNGTVCHLTMIRRKWMPDVVRRVLRAQNTTELIGETKAAELRAAMRKREQTHGERVGGHMLLRVAFCHQCGGPLYCLVQKSKPNSARYRCLKCMMYLRKDDLEHKTEAVLLFLYGQAELVEYQLVPGDDHQTAIHALQREIDTLEKITGTDMVIYAKRAEIEHLRSLPFDPDRYVPVPLGITVAENWATLDDEGKGSFLRKYRVRVFADKHNFELRAGLLEESEAGYLEPVDLAAGEPDR